MFTIDEDHGEIISTIYGLSKPYARRMNIIHSLETKREEGYF